MITSIKNKEILRQRAIANSTGKDVDGKETATLLYALSFSLMSNHYALETKHISEVLHINEITRVPGTPRTIEGVINLRGSIIPAINTRELFSLEVKGLTEQNRLIVLSSKEITLGLICDSIDGIITADLSQVGPVPNNLTKSLYNYSQGIIQNNTLLLDSIKILTSPKIIINK